MNKQLSKENQEKLDRTIADFRKVFDENISGKFLGMSVWFKTETGVGRIEIAQNTSMTYGVSLTDTTEK